MKCSKEFLGVVILLVLVLLSACSQSPLPSSGEAIQADPLPKGWTREQLEKDPTFYNESELLPNADQTGLLPSQVVCCMTMTTKTVTTSSTSATKGNAYVGNLDNRNSPTKTTVTDSFTHSWSGSATGGISVSKLKADLSISGSRSYTKSVTKVVPPRTMYRVYGGATGKALKGYQTKMPTMYAGSPCTSENLCTKRSFGAFRVEGMGLKTY